MGCERWMLEEGEANLQYTCMAAPDWMEKSFQVFVLYVGV